MDSVTTIHRALFVYFIFYVKYNKMVSNVILKTERKKKGKKPTLSSKWHFHREHSNKIPSNIFVLFVWCWCCLCVV